MAGADTMTRNAHTAAVEIPMVTIAIPVMMTFNRSDTWN